MQNLKDDTNQNLSKFLATNQEVLAKLLTFVDFSAGLTIGFIEIDREQERDWIVEWLIDRPQCQEIQFLVLTYDDPNLRFLLDEIVKSLAQNPPTNKELVLIIKGLEYSIGSTEYPPVLQNLNFVRDAFIKAVPHPILFCLPSYQITNLAKYAPDFWAWKSALFKFKPIEIESIFVSNLPVEYLSIRRTPEPQSRIDLLAGLLVQNSESSSKRDRSTLVSILQQLGNAHHSRQEFDQAELYLTEALNVIEENPSLSAARTNLWIELADVYRSQKKSDLAIGICQQVLNLDELGRYLLSALQWAEINNILGLVYINNLTEKIADNLENAIACFKSALTIYTYEEFPLNWAMTQNNLANAYKMRIIGDRGENIERAIPWYIAALSIFTRENFPLNWAMIQNNLAIAYYERIKGSRRENIKNAIECCQNALKIYTPETFPREWEQTRNLIQAISSA
jgi:tetratricopeptide (TPR) repeat protein